jgi:hypothetical protein
MAGQANVFRKLLFKGVANDASNIEGNPSTAKMVIYDPFWYDTQANYTATLEGTNDAIAAIGGGVPGLSLLSGDTDNEVSFLGTGLIFDITNCPEIETKVRITDASQTSFFFGFSDANTESTPASTIDYADGTLAAAATDAVGFVSDADKSSSLFYAASIATGGSVAAATTGITPTDTGTYVLRIRLDASGNAWFYIDGSLVYYKAAAVTDVPLCAVFNFGTRDNGGGDPVYAYYFKAWQNV